MQKLLVRLVVILTHRQSGRDAAACFRDGKAKPDDIRPVAQRDAWRNQSLTPTGHRTSSERYRQLPRYSRPPDRKSDRSDLGGITLAPSPARTGGLRSGTPAVNRLVAGSNPARGAKRIKDLAKSDLC
jgi:hypothetical protein